MSEKENILGCFVSEQAVYFDDDQETKDIASQKGEIFRGYIWGEFGICDTIRILHRGHYGNDLRLILFEFYLNPLLERLIRLKDIGRYRRSEKAIGVPIIIHDENFFNKTDFERREFLKEAVLVKLDLVEKVVKRLKLDTDMDRLKSDLRSVLFP